MSAEVLVMLHSQLQLFEDKNKELSSKIGELRFACKQKEWAMKLAQNQVAEIQADTLMTPEERSEMPLAMLERCVLQIRGELEELHREIDELNSERRSVHFRLVAIRNNIDANK